MTVLKALHQISKSNRVHQTRLFFYSSKGPKKKFLSQNSANGSLNLKKPSNHQVCHKCRGTGGMRCQDCHGKVKILSVWAVITYVGRYRVFIKYCVFFQKILEYSEVWSFSVFPWCPCAYTHQAGRTPALQQNWQSSEKSQNFKEKTQYLMNTLYWRMDVNLPSLGEYILAGGADSTTGRVQKSHKILRKKHNN